MNITQELTETNNKFTPSLHACMTRGCHYIAGNDKRTVCLIGDKELKMLSECPLDKAEMMMMTRRREHD